MSMVRTKSLRGFDPAWLVVLAGVAAALHVGKLPPALPALREALGVTLVQGGFLLSLIQLAGMSLGLAVGGLADGWGLKRSIVAGLLILFLASCFGGFASDADMLLALRAVEGLGFLLVVLSAPGLIRHLVPVRQVSTMMGLWGTFMPVGTAIALLCGPWVISLGSWQLWWWVLAGLTLGVAVWLWQCVPVPTKALPAHQPSKEGFADLRESWANRLRQTLTARGPWLVALSFCVYSAQWLAVIGFLPTIYMQAGFEGGMTAVLTALVAGVNMIGNLASGRLLTRGVRAPVLLTTGFVVMGLGAVAAFAAAPGGGHVASMPPLISFLGVLLFSMVGGVIPGTLFSLAVQRAPSASAISTTVGWVQQWSSFGQFAGPPLVAWVANAAGGWQWTWAVTGTCSLLGIMLAWMLAQGVRE